MNDLASKSCVPCRGGTPPLTEAEIAPLQAQLGSWEVEEAKRLTREYRFDNFRQALDFTVKVGEIAEAEGHHPDIHLAWGRVGIELWTHKIDGLTESDFVLAAKIERAKRDA